MKTIKIIDLLNKIVNGEEVPLKIKWDGDTWGFKEQFNDYLHEKEDEEKEYLFYIGFDNYADTKRFLNCEVEIIEEEKEIEKMHVFKDSQEGLIKIGNKINELIDAVNELRKEK